MSTLEHIPQVIDAPTEELKPEIGVARRIAQIIDEAGLSDLSALTAIVTVMSGVILDRKIPPVGAFSSIRAALLADDRLAHYYNSRRNH